jgi:hypothetical protein
MSDGGVVRRLVSEDEVHEMVVGEVRKFVRALRTTPKTAGLTLDEWLDQGLDSYLYGEES